MSRLSKLIQHKMAQSEKILSVFLTAGYPEPEATAEIVFLLEAAGVDFIELGIPFSDPIADGPTIQESSQHALDSGMTLPGALHLVENIRRHSELPIVLMGYLNPMLKYGLPRLVDTAATAGVDGFIIPDLLPETSARIAPKFENALVGLNFLVSPNTDEKRVRKVAGLTCDFLYCVSVTGVTGVRKSVSEETLAFLQRTRALADGTPCFAGFGIASGAVAAEIARHCDGVIVGSAVIKLLTGGEPFHLKLKRVSDFIAELKASLKGVGHGY